MKLYPEDTILGIGYGLVLLAVSAAVWLVV